MCYNIVTEFKYANKYEQAKEDRLRFKHIIRCTTALQSLTGILCPLALRDREHVLQEDDPKENCSEYKGETPLETLQYYGTSRKRQIYGRERQNIVGSYNQVARRLYKILP